MSVPEAAERLGLDPGRVRRLVASGLLEGRKIGGRWLVDENALADRLETQHRPGRPLSPRSAWGLLWAADNRPTPWLASRERARAIERAGKWPIDDWPWACQRRSDIRRLRAHPTALARLLADDRVVRSGASARGLNVDLIVTAEADVYIRLANAKSVIADYALIESRNANVSLRIPPQDLWLFDADDAPWPVVVADLLDASDDRSVRAAHELHKRMKAK